MEEFNAFANAYQQKAKQLGKGEVEAAVVMEELGTLFDYQHLTYKHGIDTRAG